MSLPATVLCQPAIDGIGAGSGGGEGSRFPFRIKLSGTLNPATPQERSIKIATLSISGYRETYQFEIMHAEAIDDKQLPRAAIVPQIVPTDYDYRVVGTKDLLSKIGQSLPNTPITIIGYLRQRKRELILENIETINVHGFSPSESPNTEGSPTAPISDARPPK